jgi:hypothetical protein
MVFHRLMTVRNPDDRFGSRAAVVARLMVRPVCPQLRKCRVRPGQLRLVPQAVISLHARGPDPHALGSVDNDDGLCPKPAYLQAPWIIGKRAFETDYCASLPGTAILASNHAKTR